MIDFVQEQKLPTERYKMKVNKITLSLWAIGICDWVIYISVILILTKYEHYLALWDYQFFQLCFAVFLVLISTILFGLSYLKIKKLAFQDTHGINVVELKRVAIITGICFFGQCTMLVIFMLMMLTMSNFGMSREIVTIVGNFLMSVMMIIFFVVTLRVDLDLTLST